MDGSLAPAALFLWLEGARNLQRPNCHRRVASIGKCDLMEQFRAGQIDLPGSHFISRKLADIDPTPCVKSESFD